MKTFYMVQEVIDGIAYPPVPFLNEDDADTHYIHLVNENCGQEFTDYGRASEYLSNSGADVDILFWEIEMPE